MTECVVVDGIEFEFDVAWGASDRSVGDDAGWELTRVSARVVDPDVAIEDEALTFEQACRAVEARDRIIPDDIPLDPLWDTARDCVADRLRGVKPRDYYFEG